MQEIFNRPYHQLFEPKEGTEEFFKSLESSKIDFADLYNQGIFKFKDEFRIKSIRDII